MTEASAAPRTRVLAPRSGAWLSCAWAVLSLGTLTAAAIVAIQYDRMTHALADLYHQSTYVRMTDANTVVRPAPEPARPVTLSLVDNSVERLTVALDSHAYILSAVRRGHRVPRVFVGTLPPDIGQIRTVDEKRNLFIRTMLPHILAVNERIAAERRFIVELRRRIDSAEELSAADTAWLDAVARRYKVKPRDLAGLMERVDVVPPSLAIAQTIVETGWGASAPARRNNAMFGVLGGDGTSTANLANYESVYDSVAAYAMNLNTYPAYADFRRQRAALRSGEKTIEGHALAATMLRYSELGADYTRHIQGVIQRENLAVFDEARLAVESDDES